MEDIRKVKVGMSRLEKDIQAQQIKTQVLQEVSDGSPKEVFQTLTRLESHYPTGAPGVFLVMENSDGKAHWYYWNVSMWVDGGVYIDADLSEYAKTDGSYELLTSGNAMQLINPYGNPVDKAKFDIRETYDGAEFTTGIAKVKKIKGFARKSYNLLSLGIHEESALGITVNANSLGVQLNGTSTSTVYINLAINGFFPKGITYTFGVTEKLPVGVKIYFQDDANNYNNDVLIEGNSNEIYKQKIYNKWAKVLIVIDSNTTLNNVIIKPMIVEGSEPKPFEAPGLKITAPNALISIGRNLWDEQWEVGMLSYATGQPVVDNEHIRTKNFIPVIENKSYVSNILVYAYFYDINKNYIGSYNMNPNSPITTPKKAYYMKFRTDSAYGIIYKNDIMINFGSEPLPYEPYTDTGISLAKFHDPLRHRGYGCYVNEQYYNELDLDKKVLVKRVSDVILLAGDFEDWVKQTTTGDFYQFILPLPSPALAEDPGRINLLSSWIDETANSIYLGNYGVANNSNYILLGNPSIKTVEELKAWLHNNPIQLMYVLETPEVEDVSTLFDTNKYKAIGHGQEYWLQLTNWSNLFTPSVPCEIEYQPDMAGKLAKLRTAPEQENIDTEQDRRIKALEDRIAQLTIAINGGNQQ